MGISYGPGSFEVTRDATGAVLTTRHHDGTTTRFPNIAQPFPAGQASFFSVQLHRQISEVWLSAAGGAFTRVASALNPLPGAPGALYFGADAAGTTLWNGAIHYAIVYNRAILDQENARIYRIVKKQLAARNVSLI